MKKYELYSYKLIPQERGHLIGLPRFLRINRYYCVTERVYHKYLTKHIFPDIDIDFTKNYKKRFITITPEIIERIGRGKLVINKGILKRYSCYQANFDCYLITILSDVDIDQECVKLKLKLPQNINWWMVNEES
jgi:hypothetical protein